MHSFAWAASLLPYPYKACRGYILKAIYKLFQSSTELLHFIFDLQCNTLGSSVTKW